METQLARTGKTAVKHTKIKPPEEPEIPTEAVNVPEFKVKEKLYQQYVQAVRKVLAYLQAKFPALQSKQNKLGMYPNVTPQLGQSRI